MLRIPMWVDNHEVGRVELIRVDPLNGRPADGEMCTYLLRYYNGSPDPVVDKMLSFQYVPDNPLPLAIHAMESVQLSLLTRTARESRV